MFLSIISVIPVQRFSTSILRFKEPPVRVSALAFVSSMLTAGKFERIVFREVRRRVRNAATGSEVLGRNGGAGVSEYENTRLSVTISISL